MVPFHSTRAAGSKFPSKVLKTRYEIVLEGSNRFKKRIGLGCSKKGVARDQSRTSHHQNHKFAFAQQRFLLYPPL